MLNQIVLVGTDDNVDKQLPKNIISIHRTQNKRKTASENETIQKKSISQLYRMIIPGSILKCHGTEDSQAPYDVRIGVLPTKQLCEVGVA